MTARPSNFFFDVGGVDAEQLLMEYGVEGSFLARPSSSNPRDYTLSVRRGQHIAHIKIQRTGDFLDLYGGEKFATLSELVQYYMENPDQLREKDGDEIPLKCPVQLPCEVTTTMPGVSGSEGSLWTERWFHGNTSARESEHLLNSDNAKNGSFLVRESQSVPGQLVISVRVEADNRFDDAGTAATSSKCSHVMVHRKDGKLDVGGGEYFNSMNELLEFYRKNPMVDTSGTVVYLKTPLHNTRVAASSIEGRMKALELQEGNGKFGYSVEFEDLQRLECKQFFQRKEGQRLENRAKNRYKNILPFDHTRIVLKDADPAIAGSDYINANYIEIFRDYPEFLGLEGRRYVSTQGCLSNTVDDFWRMIWQENSHIIVMTTKEMERGRMKCVRYWPDREGDVRQYGLRKEISVKLVSEDCSCPDYKVRRFELNNQCCPDQLPRIVYHWQFLGWPDHGCPSDPGSVLNFLEHVNDCLNNDCAPDSGPIVVHCSAGIGRTGTFIVIDLILNQIKRVGLQWEVDVARAVQMVREQRSGMVQTEQQYWFIYLAVTHYTDTLRQHLDAACRTPGGREYTNIKYPNNARSAGGDASGGLRSPSCTSPVKKTSAQRTASYEAAPPPPPRPTDRREEHAQMPFALEPPPIPKRPSATAATK